MNIKHHAQEIDDQVDRLKLLFPDQYTYIIVTINVETENRVEIAYRAGAPDGMRPYWRHGLDCISPTESVDSLLKEIGITSVQQYLMTNRHRFGELL